MKIEKIKYFIEDALQSLKRNSTLTIDSIITVAVTFFIVGLFLLYITSLSKNSEAIFISNKSMVIILKYIEIAAFFILPLISLLLITNGFKMVVTIRQCEISVMKSIGATEWFIRWPFIIQGLIIGIIGSFLANVSLFCAYSLIYTKAMEFLIDLSFVQPNFIIKNMLFKFIICGAFMGAIGSSMALRKVVKYR